jgi:phosphoserine phosphatase
MSRIITLVSTRQPLYQGHFDLLQLTAPGEVKWLAPEKAASVQVMFHPPKEQIDRWREWLSGDRVDLLITPVQNRRKKLLIADMDSTVVTSETLDEIAAHAGLKDKIAPITERAMRGEIDFEKALRERVALLKGLDEEILQKTLDDTVLSTGAATLIGTMKKHGATCVLVSGGFTFFTEAIAKRAGFHHHHGNVLEVAKGKLTGKVKNPVLDRGAKKNFLEQYIRDLNLTPDDALAIGDGSNDLPMLEAAGLGIGYHPKPLLKATLENCILHGDLTAALYAQGYTEV